MKNHGNEAVLHEQLEVVKLLMQRSADPLARTTDECKLSPRAAVHNVMDNE